MATMLGAVLAFAEASGPVFHTSGWFLENVWLIPLIMGLSFAVILFFGKRMPFGGSEIGITAVSVCFVIALLTAGQWIGQVRQADKDGGGEGEHALVVDGASGEVAAAAEEEEGDGHGGEAVAGCFPDKGDKTDDGHADEDEEHALGSAVGPTALAPSALAGDKAGPNDQQQTASGSPVTAGDEAGPNDQQQIASGVYLAEESHGAAPCPVINNITWFSMGGHTFEVGTFVDGLTVTLLVVVTLVSLLVHIYSTDYVAGDRRFTHYFAFLSLFTASMLFFVTSSSTLQMVVGWELVGVCSFSLIGHWWEEQANSDAALKAFITNRVGDMGLLVGMITLFWISGQTWQVYDINHLANTGELSQGMMLLAASCLILAVMSKSGQFFLHTWLPDAMAGPTPVSALIHAATMVVAGIYMVGRLYGVFFNGFEVAGHSINLLAVVGGVTTLVGASLAFVQVDIKKVLAYSTISQLGYMAMALGVGAWTAAIFHLMTHAFFKACLFLGAGSVSHSVHSFDMKEAMGGMRKFMPHTYRTFLIGSLALAGLPPLAGFWSKDEILVGTGGWPNTNGNGTYTLMLVMGLITAVLTGMYMSRVIYLTFFGEFRGAHHLHHDHSTEHNVDDHGEAGPGAVPHESGPRIVVPLYILAFLALTSGFLNFPPGFQLVPESWGERFGHYVEPKAPAGYFPAISHATPSWSLAIFSTLIVLAGIGVTALYYRRVHAQDPAATELANGLVSRNRLARAGYTLLVNKYYLDWLYTGVIVGFVKGPLARAVVWFNQNVLDGIVNGVGRGAVKSADIVYNYIDQPVIDGAVNLSGRASYDAGGELRRMQTGKVQQYAGLLFAAAAILAGLIIVFV